MLNRIFLAAALGLSCFYVHALPVDPGVKCNENIFKGVTEQAEDINICFLGNGNIRYTQRAPNQKAIAMTFDEPVSNTRLVLADKDGIDSQVLIIGNQNVIITVGVQEKNKSGIKEVLVAWFNSEGNLRATKIDTKTLTHRIGRNLLSKGVKEAKE